MIAESPARTSLWLEIKMRTAQGVSLSRIAADLGIDRKTARKHRDAESDPKAVPIVRHRASRFAAYEAYIREQIGAGVRVSQIARELERRSNQRIAYSSLWEYVRKL